VWKLRIDAGDDADCHRRIHYQTLPKFHGHNSITAVKSPGARRVVTVESIFPRLWKTCGEPVRSGVKSFTEIPPGWFICE
jgi:hypothetical protein